MPNSKCSLPGNKAPKYSKCRLLSKWRKILNKLARCIDSSPSILTARPCFLLKDSIYSLMLYGLVLLFLVIYWFSLSVRCLELLEQHNAVTKENEIFVSTSRQRDNMQGSRQVRRYGTKRDVPCKYKLPSDIHCKITLNSVRMKMAKSNFVRLLY